MNQLNVTGIIVVISNESSARKAPFVLTPALYLDDYLSACHFVCALLGIPLNAWVMSTIVGYKRLHLHRTFIWLGVGFSNIFLLISHIAEFLAVQWPSPATDQLCAWFSGLPYLNLLVNSFLPLLERHLCLKHSTWYKRHMNSCWAITAWQTMSFLILVLIVKSRHFLAYLPLQWQLNMPDIKIMSSLVLAASVLCLVAQVAVWTISRRSYPSAATNDISMTSRALRVGTMDEDPSQTESASISPFVCIEDERISRLDLEVARAMTINTATLLSFFAPALTVLAFLFICLSSASHQDCTREAQALYYARELISIPCFFISPVFFVVSSRAFRSALRDKMLEDIHV